MAPVGGLGLGRKSDESEAPEKAVEGGHPDFEPVRLARVVTNEVGFPSDNSDGSRGVYTVVFQLSYEPSARWGDYLVHYWDRPQVAYAQGKHRPGMVSVVANRLMMEETTIDEVEGFHLPVLKAAVRMANEAEARALVEDHRRAERRQLVEAEHRRHIAEVAKRLPLE
ncbi:MAG: hypothetical protein ACRDJP_00880 [Actinomycetota bacterium]